MFSELNFNIKNMGPINESNIEIGKVNVIGGLNATGKSTTSKLLYCLLKGNVKDRKNFAFSLISRSIRNFLIHNDLNNFHKLRKDDDLDNLLELYSEIREKILNDIDVDFNSDSFKDTIFNIDKQIKIIDKNDNQLYLSILNNLLSSEFASLNLRGSMGINGSSNGNDFNYLIDFYNNQKSCSGFFTLSDVFYIDSFSILDVNSIRLKTKLPERINYLTKCLSPEANESLEFLDEEINKKIIEVESKINNLIKGTFESKNNRFSFKTKSGKESTMDNTSSGIKQIGVIQILLANRKLKEDSFLIIDEPEVNLHPEWQIKLAEILVLLASELNIYVYINSHSPMFIEAMSLFSEKYGLLEDSNFYLTEKQNEGFTFKHINSKDMGAVYENLTSPYDELDKIKAEILFKE